MASKLNCSCPIHFLLDKKLPANLQTVPSFLTVGVIQILYVDLIEHVKMYYLLNLEAS